MTLRNYIGTRIAHAGLTTMLAGAMLVGLSACGGTTAATPTTGASGAGTTATQTIGPTDTTGSASATMSPDMSGSASATMSPDMGGAASNTPATTGGSAATPPASSGTAGTAVTPQAGQGAGNATVVQGTLKEWAIDLSQKEVPAGKVRFIVTNAGQFKHNFTVTNAGGTIGATSTFGSADGPQTLEVTLTPGAYTIICSLPGHAARGQKVDLTVK